MNVEIAERLAKRRREAGYSQENLAEKLGVSRQAVSKWERSESSPDTDNLIALAQLYGVSLDELLYVDETLKDDVAFEAADRAASRKEGAAGAAGAADSAAGADEQGKPGKPDKDSDFKIGLGGIHIVDGEDVVSLSWKDGIHVKDADTGEEVRVGWKGIHVSDGKDSNNEGSSSAPGEDTSSSGDWGDAKVYINGKKYDSWDDVNVAFKDKYGIEKTWLKFPFPLVVIIAYILIGVFLNAWAVGLFVFFTVPVYYMIAHAAYTKRFGEFLAGFYPLASIAWFLWMAFVVGEPHPAWVVFLTIPVVEWLIHVARKSYKKRKQAKQVIDIE